MFFILNAFSPSMLTKSFSIVNFIKLSQEEARAIFKSEGTFISAIGHESTAKIVSNILYSEIQYQRISVNLIEKDKGLIFVLSFRPEEGKVYDYLELCHLMDEGGIQIYYFEVIA